MAKEEIKKEYLEAKEKLTKRCFYRHRKSKRVYLLINIALDATNGNEGKLTAVYSPLGSTKNFSRDLLEFAKKFEEFNEE